jgi:hypothetical protein
MIAAHTHRKRGLLRPPSQPGRPAVARLDPERRAGQVASLIRGVAERDRDQCEAGVCSTQHRLPDARSQGSPS